MKDGLVVLDPEGALADELASAKPDVITTEAQAHQELRRSRESLWIADTYGARLLVSAPASRGNQRLLVVDDLGSGRLELLRFIFRAVVGRQEPYRVLPREELMVALKSPRGRDLVVAGVVDFDDQLLILYRGDLTRLVVPIDSFRPNATGLKPDMAAFQVTDFGQTLRFGEYEAATHAVLYGADQDYRRREDRDADEREGTFGSQLRNMRLAKRIPRSGFPGVTEREVARIESGEVERPHLATLKVMAEGLGVPIDTLIEIQKSSRLGLRSRAARSARRMADLVGASRS